MGWPKWDNNSRADWPMLKMPLVRISPLGGIVWAYLFSFWQLMTKSCGTVTALLRCCKAQWRTDSLDHTNNIQEKEKAYTQVLHLGIRSFFWKCPFVQQKIVAFFGVPGFFSLLQFFWKSFFVFFWKKWNFFIGSFVCPAKFGSFSATDANLENWKLNFGRKLAFFCFFPFFIV